MFVSDKIMEQCKKVVKDNYDAYLSRPIYNVIIDKSESCLKRDLEGKYKLFTDETWLDCPTGRIQNYKNIPFVTYLEDVTEAIENLLLDYLDDILPKGWIEDVEKYEEWTDTAFELAFSCLE